MNLSLHDPLFITADFPTTLTTTLSYGHCTALQISPCGHYIASGLIDGSILIIDTWSNNVTSIIKKHSMSIIGLKWIYNEIDDGDEDDNNIVVGLISWSKDWKLCFHNLVDHKMTVIWEHVFSGGVWNVDVVQTGVIDHDFNKLINWKIVVCRGIHGISLVSYDAASENEFKVQQCKKIDGNDDDDDDEDTANIDYGDSLCCCAFYGGKYIIAGTKKGWVQIIDSLNANILKCEKICNANIKGISIVEKSIFNKDDDNMFGLDNVQISRLIINASDRILRQYDITDWYKNPDLKTWLFEIEQKYQDVVNRIQWNTVKFSPTGEYVCASTQGGSGAAHDIYIWETEMGSLVQILEGAHEELLDVDWGVRSTNGNVCCISSNGIDSGTIYIWGVKATPKWSALAPDFEEIEQNIEYVEMEDEFDLQDDDENDDKMDQDNDSGNDNDNDNDNDHSNFGKFKVDVITKEETDARGFKFIKGCIIDTEF